MRVSDTRTIVFATPTVPLPPPGGSGSHGRAFLVSVEITRRPQDLHEKPRIMLKFDTMQMTMPRDFNVVVQELHDLRAVLDEAIAEIESGK